MSRRRVAGAIAAGILAAASLAACSSQPSSAKATHLTVEDYYAAQPESGVMDAIYAACGKSAGVTVTANHVPGNNLIAKVLQQGSSKTLPDVLMLDNPDVPQIAATGALAPLSNYGVSTAGVASSVISVGTYKGKLYGLAPTVNTLGFFYNTAMFKAAGITTPPTTWDQLRTDAKKLTKPGQYGFALGAYPDEGDAWSFLPFMWTNGGNEKDLTDTGTVQALQFLTELKSDGSMPTSVVNWEQGDVANQFSAGKVAMMINGPWNIKPFEQTKNLSWAASTVPTRVPGQKVQSPLGGEAFTIPNTGNAANMKAAGKLISCINTATNERKIADATGNIPSLTSAAQAFGASDARVAPFVTLVGTARSRTGELGTKWPTAAKGIYTAEGLAFTGKADAAAALKQAQNQ